MTVDEKILGALVLMLAPLSLVSIGGGPATIADMQRQAVAVHGWMTQREFVDLFAVSRAAPGPGALLVTLVGWKAAGWLGALAASLAFFLPSSLLAYGAVHFWRRRDAAWRRAVEAGLAPIGAGLIMAGAYTMLRSEGMGLSSWAVVLSVAAIRLWRPDWHPLLLLGFGAAVFMLISR
jgi:chromate transporter